MKILEETAELINILSSLQIYISKLLGYKNMTNDYIAELRASIEEEMGDTLAQIDIFIENNELNKERIIARKHKKYTKYKV